MSSAVVRTGSDTWIESYRPGVEHYTAPFLRLQGGTTTKVALLWTRNPAPRNATVLSATLYLATRDAIAGGINMTVRRITQKYGMGKVNFNNRPATTASGSSTQGTGAVAANGRVDLDITDIVQAWCNGAPNYGVEISTPSSILRRFHSFNSKSYRPYITVVWTTAPKKPTNLVPSSAAVATDKPVLTFNFNDTSGNTQLAQAQVQISPTKSTSATTYTVTTSAAQVKLADTAYPGLAANATTYWRVRAKDGSGLWSPWSDWASFTRRTKGTLTFVSPSPADKVVDDVSPPIVWDFTGTQTGYQVLLAKASAPGKWIYNSGERESDVPQHTIPSKVIKDNTTYRVTVRVFDQYEREAVPGDPPYVSKTQEFTVRTVSGVAAPTNFTVQHDDAPLSAILRWERTEAPDSWNIIRDGVVLDSGLLASDLHVSGSTYEYRDYSLKSDVPHTYSVRAVVNGQQSPGATPVEVPATHLTGIHLIDPDRHEYVVIADADEGSWSEPEEAEVFAPVGASSVVRIVSGARGKEGSLGGLLIDGFGGLTIDEQVEVLYGMKSRPAGPVRMALADENIPVILGNISIAPSIRTRKGQRVREVSFDFWQTGEVGFNLNI